MMDDDVIILHKTHFLSVKSNYYEYIDKRNNINDIGSPSNQKIIISTNGGQ